MVSPTHKNVVFLYSLVFQMQYTNQFGFKSNTSLRIIFKRRIDKCISKTCLFGCNSHMCTSFCCCTLLLDRTRLNKSNNVTFMVIQLKKVRTNIKKQKIKESIYLTQSQSEIIVLFFHKNAVFYIL